MPAVALVIPVGRRRVRVTGDRSVSVLLGRREAGERARDSRQVIGGTAAKRRAQRVQDRAIEDVVGNRLLRVFGNGLLHVLDERFALGALSVIRRVLRCLGLLGLLLLSRGLFSGSLLSGLNASRR